MSQWITENCPHLEKWAQAHDTGARYGIMTSNMSEVYNGVLKGVRALPITALIEETWNRTLSYFADRVTVAKAQVELNKPWSEKMQRHLDEKAKKSQSHGCRKVDALRNKWEVNVRASMLRVTTEDQKSKLSPSAQRPVSARVTSPSLRATLAVMCSGRLLFKKSASSHTYRRTSTCTICTTLGTVSSGLGALI